MAQASQRAAGSGRHLSINIPNVVTIGRVILVPVIFWLLVSGNTKLAFYAFVCAGVSDAVDGYLAKRFHLQTQLGALLDPLADKLLIVSIYVALGVAAKLPSWLVIAVVSRDILIVTGVVLAWMFGQAVHIKPLGVSKANTASQILLAATVLADEGFGLGLDQARTALVWITGTLTILSLAAYLRQWLGLMSGEATAQDDGAGR
jgi:cardiolipin synthase (CMP-forming)